MYIEKWAVRVIMVLVAICLLFSGVYFGGQLIDENKPLIADFIVAIYAQKRAGEKVPFGEDIIYSQSDLFVDWNTLTNSTWLTNYARLIIPYTAYDNVTTRSRYPEILIFLPNLEYRSLHTSGHMNPYNGWVFLNERHVLEWNDQRNALSTLVHELVHLQGGLFVSGGGPEKFEPRTVAATTEILAAMCNYGDELACSAFWNDIRYLSLTSLKYNMHKKGKTDIYNFIYDIFFIREDKEVVQRARDKSMRYWENDMRSYWYLVLAYGVKPWEIVIDGIGGEGLETGHSTFCPKKVKFYANYMAFDDTMYLMGWLANLLEFSYGK